MFKIFRTSVLLFLLAGGVLPATAQVKLGNNPDSLSPAAILELETTNQGLLPPRMLSAQMNSIATPVAGMLVYCTNCSPAGLYTYNGSTWVGVGIVSPPPVATFVNNTLSCSGAINGLFYKGVEPTSGNSKEILIHVNTTGSYTATTNTVNGVTFSASGTLLSTGPNKVITLQATGVPIKAGNYGYIARIGGQSCVFGITYSSPATPLCGASSNTITPAGSLVSGTSYSGSYSLPYTGGTGVAYGALTLSQSGLSLTRTAGTYANGGIGNVTYTLSGTYTGGTPPVEFTTAEGCAVSIPSNYVSTFAGAAGVVGITDDTGTAARFYRPTNSAVDANGNIFVTDYLNHTIRKITPEGAVTTFAGSPNNSGSTDGTGSAARFNRPYGIAINSSGVIYVSEFSNHTIRRITPSGVVTTLAGSAGSAGTTDGTGSAARFNNPSGIAVGAGGTLYVADASNNTIRQVGATGTVTTFVGSAGVAGSTDGTGSAARFDSPTGVAVDAGGNVFVTDRDNNTIRKVTAGSTVTTLAGTAGVSGSADGAGSAARFNRPYGIDIDESGMLYVTDYFNNTIRKISSSGVVSTLAGSAGSSGSTDAAGSAARFFLPRGVMVTKKGILYICDYGNQTIRKLLP